MTHHVRLRVGVGDASRCMPHGYDGHKNMVMMHGCDNAGWLRDMTYHRQIQGYAGRCIIDVQPLALLRITDAAVVHGYYLSQKHGAKETHHKTCWRRIAVDSMPLTCYDGHGIRQKLQYVP
ncbi:hypothetical protein AVEN_33643-1 [Araneus ventricosus]|uniref:Uncharacterized protein n=1 Tax=Araneus ventricosus TaxID=182803 RepID=A0A4Y2TSE3_ARAVE|nr:hypothetical protein AVEN_33643-1 [Araneus ventricosus]